MWDHDRVIHLALAVLKIGARGKKVGWAIGFPEVKFQQWEKSQKIIFPCCIFSTHSFVQRYDYKIMYIWVNEDAVIVPKIRSPVTHTWLKIHSLGSP